MAKWGELVKQMLLKQTAKVASSAPRKHFRVPAPLRKASTEPAYSPEFVSLGPNHFRKPETHYHCDDLMMFSTNEGYKVKAASAVLGHKLMSIQSKQLRLDDIVNDIEVMRPQIESCYDWSNTDNEYRDHLSLLMVVDSLFILQFLFGHGRRVHGTQIKCDILKLENQIPMCVLKTVFEKVKEALLHPDLYRYICYEDASRINRLLLQTAYTELSPLDIAPDDLQIDDAMEKEEPHLLGCIHAIVSEFLTIQQNVQADKREPTRRQIICNYLAEHVVEKMCRIFFRSYKPGDFPIKGYTAEELGKAGIKFKAFSKPSGQYIWFDKYSQKLYLPRVIVTSPTHTEVFFKNLLAFEFNDAGRNNHVRHFIQLMDALIDTSRDVRKLRKSGVIRLKSALSDESLVKSWDRMHQPFSTGHIEPPEELKRALDEVLTTKCCMIKCRIAIPKYFTSIISQVSLFLPKFSGFTHAKF